MAIPRKKSRLIEFNGSQYRWMVTKKGSCNLTIELDDDPGQVFRIYLEPFNRYRRNENDEWEKSGQGRTITPGYVKSAIQFGIANGWEPTTKGLAPMVLYSWEANNRLPPNVYKDEHETFLENEAESLLEELRHDISLDPKWRKILFESSPGEKLKVPQTYLSLGKGNEQLNLEFVVFNDGCTECGFVVFGMQSVQFPYLTYYSTNNPEII